MIEIFAISFVWCAFGVMGVELMRRYAGDRGCPSPLGLAIIVIISLFGPIIFISALFVRFVDWLDEFFDRDTWLTRPICKRKDGQ